MALQVLVRAPAGPPARLKGAYDGQPELPTADDQPDIGSPVRERVWRASDHTRVRSSGSYSDARPGDTDTCTRASDPHSYTDRYTPAYRYARPTDSDINTAATNIYSLPCPADSYAGP